MTRQTDKTCPEKHFKKKLLWLSTRARFDITTWPAPSVWLLNLCGTTWITSRSSVVIFYSASPPLRPSSTSFLRRSIHQPSKLTTFSDSAFEPAGTCSQTGCVVTFSSENAHHLIHLAFNQKHEKKIAEAGGQGLFPNTEKSTRQEVLRRTLITTFVTTDLQLADPLAKPTATKINDKFVPLLGLIAHNHITYSTLVEGNVDDCLMHVRVHDLILTSTPSWSLQPLSSDSTSEAGWPRGPFVHSLGV